MAGFGDAKVLGNQIETVVISVIFLIYTLVWRGVRQLSD
ncbi:Uncharacterized protein dnm_069100 [Desulfonema magnum]|uniref:Uncharacterized protein n=1 Tax=Desulfonema magnum TaxID=45655 RepID=A0A975BSK9_9BACT|nr:Uncharacterized protein dnm_069100 [Desulfonema magnum]